jgi:hypothetical protein
MRLRGPESGPLASVGMLRPGALPRTLDRCEERE